MNYITVDVKILKSQQERIYIPSSLLQKLKLNNNQKIPINFGLTKSKEVFIKSYKSIKNEIIITTALKRSLLFPFKKKVLLKKERNGIRIGPLVGIFTTDITGNKFSNPATSASHPHSIFFKSLIKPEHYFPSFYFVFTPNNVNWKTKTIKGFFHVNKNDNIKTWQTIEVPFPDVVYNRIPNRTVEKKDTIVNFKQNYLNLGGQIFNYDFFNKWDIYQILNSNINCYKYIPETYLNPSLDKFIKMVNKYPVIYLKPTNGSLGLGIFKIEKLNNYYILKHRLGSNNVSRNFKNIASIYKYIFSKKRARNYLLQQGIDLIKYQNNPVDFRVQLHKDQIDEWQVTAIGAKVAGRNSVTTHLRTGGKLLDALKFLDHKFNNQSNAVVNNIKFSAINIAQAIEISKNNPIGELGLDIGIDNNQNIWLFEVNSKPGRSIFKHPSLKTSYTKSNLLLLQYATHLAGFSENKQHLKDEVIL